MLQIIDNFTYFQFFLLIFAIVVVRYVVIAMPMYYIYWVLKPSWSQRYKIQLNSKRKIIPKTELYYSISTVFINGLWGVALFWFYKQGIFKVYQDPLVTFWDYGYFILSIFIAMAIHDAYFYWAHRAMHTKLLYKRVHAVHHKSINPTPLSAYCFHPIEAFLELFFLLPMLMVLPMHGYAVFIFLFITFWFNVEGHTGIEFNPRGMWDAWWGGWLTTPTHHNLHHQKFACNYALYYRYWDKFFGTLHPDTGKIFKEIKDRKLEDIS